MFYVSALTYPCIIILNTHYGRLLPLATVFSPLKYIRISIGSLVLGSLELDPGLWILGSYVQGSRPWVLGPEVLGPGVLVCGS